MEHKVLEICPYEPPSSGWVNRVKLLRRVIEEKGGECEILDIGPSRTVERPGCICVYGGLDYLKKVRRFASGGYVLHCHVNGRYFRGILLAIAAQAIGLLYGSRRVTTFHAGLDQPFLFGWRAGGSWPFYRTLFGLSQAVVCNSEPVRERLRVLVSPSKVHAIPAFSRQYMEYEEADLGVALQDFISKRSPLVSTYVCYRPGFYIDELMEALELVVQKLPELGLVIVGTGDDREVFEEELQSRKLSEAVFIAGNLDHDSFLTLLSASDIHLRTPTSDGVSSTVLEALALKTPVLAADNGTRPESAVLYNATDPADLCENLVGIVEDILEVSGRIPDDIIPDTAEDEVRLLLHISS